MTDNTYTYIQFAQGACWMHMCMYWMYHVCIYFQCICAVCICMYLYVSVCTHTTHCVYCIYVVCTVCICPGRHWCRHNIPQRPPAAAAPCGPHSGRPWAAARPLFSAIGDPLPDPVWRTRARSTRWGGGKASPWRHQWSPPTLFAYGDLASSPIRADLGGLFRAAGSWAAATPPANPHPTLFEGAVYGYVSVCMCMYGIYLYV